MHAPVTFVSLLRLSLPMSRRERMLVAYRAGSDLLGRVAVLLLTVAAARRLTTEAFGVFALGATLGWLASVVSDAGMQMHLAREVARRPRQGWPLLVRWLRARAILATVVLMGMAGALGAAGVPASTATPLLWLTAGGLVTGLVELVHHLFRGLERSDLESAISGGQRLASLVAGALALAWTPAVTPLAASLAVPPIVALLVSALVARRVAPSAPGAGSGSEEPSRTTWREFRRDVAPIGAGVLLSALYFRIDAVLIGVWLDAAAVGLYGAVFRLVDALRLFPAAALAVALPSLCRAADLSTATRLAVPLTVSATLVALATGWLAGALVPALYGPDYAQAVPAFQALLVAFPLMTFNYVLTQQLVGWNGQRAFAWLSAVALAANLALNAWLIPVFGIVGAAWTTVATELVLTIGCVAWLLDHVRKGAALAPAGTPRDGSRLPWQEGV